MGGNRQGREKKFTRDSHDVTLLIVDCASVSFAFKVT